VIDREGVVLDAGGVSNFAALHPANTTLALRKGNLALRAASPKNNRKCHCTSADFVAQNLYRPSRGASCLKYEA
jgi:hypothetical protein